MLIQIFKKFFSKHNDRILLKTKKIVESINRLESKIKKLTDTDLAKKTFLFREKINKGANINDFLIEAFAIVREASIRVFNMRHFDVQLIGGIILNNRCIAEMKTGEGKTLTATLPAYLNALSGNGVHIVTVNDYLAKRDAEHNRDLFEFLGLKVGINLSGISREEKRKAYLADITYGTNNEYGFDYLRDNMSFSSEERVQRKLYYALIDEVDSILIDEARTPLIISGKTDDNSEIYKYINELIPYLIRQNKEDSEYHQGNGHFSIDEKNKQINLTERGLSLIEKLLVKFKIIKEDESLYSSRNIILMQHIHAALKAHFLFFCNIDYIVKKNEVIIIDEHTGRAMPGRRWSDGLHQAIEAKEKVTIQNENKILASITFQNYFRLYEKLSGMTGTASTEAFEFKSIYKLNTIKIPTNRPMIRKDFPDLIYMTKEEKINAIIKEIKLCIKKKQPVLVGTISIEKSELISKKLKKFGIFHKVLNAKFHEMEAEIISQAGRPGSVTIATNMAGRGTDIILGGNYKSEILKLKHINKNNIIAIKKDWNIRNKNVIKSGGLHVIGTERHESRRIDNQLLGRSGRQGDAGSSRFYLSMEDDLMRIFASNKVSIMMRKIGVKKNEAIEHPWITKAIYNAQYKVESRNFEIRKQLLEYDDVINDQRCVIYSQRNEILEINNVSKIINAMRIDVLNNIFINNISFEQIKNKYNIKNFKKELKIYFNLNISIEDLFNNNNIVNKKNIINDILNNILSQYKEKEKIIGTKIMRKIEKNIMLKTIDSFWTEHLSSMDYLRKGIHLRSYAQQDPKQEYKKESFFMFSSMIESIKYEIINTLTKIQKNIFYK